MVKTSCIIKFPPLMAVYDVSGVAALRLEEAVLELERGQASL
jgi:hypothetical protein